jgi:predicted permease
MKMKRTLQEWTNLAEIIGNAAIILSLVFVGLQISDSTKEMRGRTAYDATVALQTWYNEIGTNEQAAEVFRKGMNDPTSLSKDEALQFVMCMHSAMLAYQTIYFVGVEGQLDEAMYLAMSSTLEAAVPTPGFAWYWEQRHGYMTDEFRVFIKQIITTHPEGGAEIYN